MNIRRLITKLPPLNRHIDRRIHHHLEQTAVRAADALRDGNLGISHDLTHGALARYGHKAAYPMVTTWCGGIEQVTALDPDADGFVGVRPVFLGPDGETTDASTVPAPVRWTGQIIAARAAGDDDTFEALLTALPEDEHECCSHLRTLLGMVVMMA